jgi:hypothetical protein
LNFSNSKLVLLHISFVVDTGLLTTNKISIIASLFIEDSFRKKFALVGFVVHKGSLDSGHYIAYVVDADHNPLQWVSFDDLEGVTVVFKPSSFFENITSDTSSHVCLLIYGEISNELTNFHSELKTEGNLNIHIYLNQQLNVNIQLKVKASKAAQGDLTIEYTGIEPSKEMTSKAEPVNTVESPRAPPSKNKSGNIQYIYLRIHLLYKVYIY